MGLVQFEISASAATTLTAFAISFLGDEDRRPFDRGGDAARRVFDTVRRGGDAARRGEGERRGDAVRRVVLALTFLGAALRGDGEREGERDFEKTSTSLLRDLAAVFVLDICETR